MIDKSIDWPCQITKLYSNSNLGCRECVSGAINWFFENEEEGIILEDDCVPHPDFFTYCAELLERYRNDTRVWCISGTNVQRGHWRGDGSYYFSRYNHCWGWASWRRCWQNYDKNLEQWPKIANSSLLKTIFDDPVERKYWQSIWQRLAEQGEPDTWDYQWTFTCLVNGGLTALPNYNLVKNIGFGDKDATHTQNVSNLNPKSLISEGLGIIRHPSFVLRDSTADSFTFNFHHNGRFKKLPLILIALPLKKTHIVYINLKKILVRCFFSRDSSVFTTTR